MDATVLNEPAVEEGQVPGRGLHGVARDIENNEGVLIDYGQRSRAGRPILTSRAEGTVNQLANARMNKCRQMC